MNTLFWGSVVERLNDLEEIAEKGPIEARYLLGRIYSRGPVVEGLKGLEEIAEKGHIEAQYLLGQIYSREIAFTMSWGESNAPCDFSKAEKYYTDAAKQGCEASKSALKKLWKKRWVIQLNPENPENRDGVRFRCVTTGGKIHLDVGYVF